MAGVMLTLTLDSNTGKATLTQQGMSPFVMDANYLLQLLLERQVTLQVPMLPATTRGIVSDCRGSVIFILEEPPMKRRVNKHIEELGSSGGIHRQRVFSVNLAFPSTIYIVDVHMTPDGWAVNKFAVYFLRKPLVSLDDKIAFVDDLGGIPCMSLDGLHGGKYSVAGLVGGAISRYWDTPFGQLPGSVGRTLLWRLASTVLNADEAAKMAPISNRCTLRELLADQWGFGAAKAEGSGRTLTEEAASIMFAHGKGGQVSP